MYLFNQAISHAQLGFLLKQHHETPGTAFFTTLSRLLHVPQLLLPCQTSSIVFSPGKTHGSTASPAPLLLLPLAVLYELLYGLGTTQPSDAHPGQVGTQCSTAKALQWLQRALLTLGDAHHMQP